VQFLHVTWANHDTWILVIAVLTAMSCAILGNFMVLRRLSMMGDAISHAVLPGIAIAFMLTESRDSVVMFIGAAIAGVLTAFFTQTIHQFGRVEQGASMGVVFTFLFACGLILIDQHAHDVDLDADCVLLGSLEWVPLYPTELLGYTVPSAFVSIGIVFLINLATVTLLFKEFRISSFDPAMASSQGISATLMHYILMVLVAVTTVAAFVSVGSIMVICMLIVPAAAAHLLTDRLHSMIIVSLIIAAVAAALGHYLALWLPPHMGFRGTNIAGMISVVCGALLLLAMFLSPRHGIVAKYMRRLRLGFRITREDILGLLYRLDRVTMTDSLPDVPSILRGRAGTGALMYRSALFSLVMDGNIEKSHTGYTLTDSGREAAGNLVRSHRLWESFLHEKLGLPVEALHYSAEQFEHITSSDMQDALASRTSSVEDPHGKAIPDRVERDSDA
jgi:manganese/zinc/iron transport system permease protein